MLPLPDPWAATLQPGSSLESGAMASGSSPRRPGAEGHRRPVLGDEGNPISQSGYGGLSRLSTFAGGEESLECFRLWHVWVDASPAESVGSGACHWPKYHGTAMQHSFDSARRIGPSSGTWHGADISLAAMGPSQEGHQSYLPDLACQGLVRSFSFSR